VLQPKAREVKIVGVNLYLASQNCKLDTVISLYFQRFRLVIETTYYTCPIQASGQYSTSSKISRITAVPW